MAEFIPWHIISAMTLMSEHGFSPYLVGGCVRDYIMGTKPNDYDITVNASPGEIIEVFNSEGYVTELKGKQFGTVAVRVADEELEITPHRIESGYSDSRHPDSVRFVKDLKLDLIRRDFTINAMAMDKNHNIIDEFGGLDDIKNGIIRCVGDPLVRFGEDALRILRAVRFASRFGFDLEPETMRAMSLRKSGLCSISGERTRIELEGILNAPYSYGVLADCGDIINEAIGAFSADEFLMKNKGDFVTRLFSCVYGNKFEEICSLCDRLKLTCRESEKLRTMYLLYRNVLSRDGKRVLFDDRARMALCDYDVDYVASVFLFSGSDTEYLEDFIENGVYLNSRLAYSGGDIAKSGLFPKNETAKLLKKVLYAVACGETGNTREEISGYLEKIRKKESE